MRQLELSVRCLAEGLFGCAASGASPNDDPTGFGGNGTTAGIQVTNGNAVSTTAGATTTSPGATTGNPQGGNGGGPTTRNGGDNTAAQFACNALLGFGLPESDGKAFVDRLWMGQIPTGQWRYYDGTLYMLGLLHVAGAFKLYY